MVANILPADPPTTLGWFLNQLFHTMVMLHIKLKGMMHAATCGAYILPAGPPRP